MSHEKNNSRLNVRIGDLCVDMGWVSINKKKEKICGDYFHIVEKNDTHVLVLSDGLGSGVKANVLATLTAQMLSTMVAGEVPIREAVKTVAQTLPICSVRKMAYSTFTILQFQPDAVYLVQYDNPDAILIRNGKAEKYPIYHSYLGEKEFHETMLTLQEEDMLILMSDGITNAGLGETTYEGWSRDEVADFCSQRYEKGMNAREMAFRITSAALALNLYGVNDDMTALVLRFCKPQITNLMIGPPQNAEYDKVYMDTFFNNNGRHIICGGTTAHIAAEYLGKSLKTVAGSAQDDIPSAMQLDGVDYITEGQLTLNRLVEYCEEWVDDPQAFFSSKKRHDPAMNLVRMLFFESTHIRVFFGKADNKEQVNLGMTAEGKQKTVEKLISHLKAQGKDVQIAYWAV